MSSSIAAVIASKNRRKIIRAFRRAQATSAQSARSLAEIGLHESLVFRIQKSRGVVVETEPGRYYLDEEQEAKNKRLRRILLAFIMALAVVLAVYTYWGNL